MVIDNFNKYAPSSPSLSSASSQLPADTTALQTPFLPTSALLARQAPNHYYTHSILATVKGQAFRAILRLLHVDLEVRGSNPRNNLYTCGGKTVYIYPLKTSLGGSLLHWVNSLFHTSSDGYVPLLFFFQDNLLLVFWVYAQSIVQYSFLQSFTLIFHFENFLHLFFTSIIVKLDNIHLI
ncbi:hypothetical protein AAZV13_01G129100 [Glycine max]